VSQNQSSHWRRAAILACWAGVAVTRVQDYPTALAVPATWLLLSAHRPRLKEGLALILAGGISSVVLVLGLNTLQTGDPFLNPFQLVNGQQMGSALHHNLWRALFNLAFYALRLGWWMPPYFLGLLLLRLPRERDWGLLVGILSQVVFYMCYFSLAGGEWGARFYTISITLSCLLAGAAFTQLRLSGLGLLTLGALTTACDAQTFNLAYAYYAEGSAPEREVDQEVEKTPTLVFVRRVAEGEVLTAAVINHPDFRPPIIAISLSPEQNEEIRKKYSDYRCMVLDIDRFGNQSVRTLSPYPKPSEVFSSASYYQAGKRYIDFRYPDLVDREKALFCFKKSLPSAHPATTYAAVGLLERDLNHLEDARDALRQALDYDPDNKKIRIEYVKVLLKNHQDKEAEAQIEQFSLPKDLLQKT